MATLAAIFRRPDDAVAARGERPAAWVADPYRLRPIHGEDVYLFQKKIDNSRVVRQADPMARRRSLRAVAMSFMAAIVFMILLLPHGLNVIAGYHIYALQREHDQLKNDRKRLELEESRQLSPVRLHQLAQELQMVDPDPNRVVYPAEGLALNTAGK